MSKTAKKPKSNAEKAAQAMRSQRNKARRIARNRTKGNGLKNPGHVSALLRRRLRRLERASKTAGKDRQNQISSRVKEIEALLAA